MIPIYAVRRFAVARADRRNFELYNVRTGACESFPGTRRDLEIYAKRLNTDEAYRTAIKGAQ